MACIRRRPISPRPDWMSQADGLGYTYYRNADGSLAWREDVRYELDRVAVARIRRATRTLLRMCLDTVEDAVNQPGGLDEFHIPPAHQAFIRASWTRRDAFLIGRFDLAWNNGLPKLIEYNADTPATIPESTQMQTAWHRQSGAPHDHAPLNVHQLIEHIYKLRATGRINNIVHVVPYPDSVEDAAHSACYLDWLQKAGMEGLSCELKDLEIATDGRFLHQGRIIRTMLRMYPWELMFRDDGARHLQGCGCTFLNPPWVALLSNKALLPILWRRYRGHPNLLAAGYTPEALAGEGRGPIVEKPIHARGGENVRILIGDQAICHEGGTYGSYPKIYQRFVDHRIDGVTTSIGAWIIGEQFAGITMRESADPIIRHSSAIVPHVVTRGGAVAASARAAAFAATLKLR